MEYATPVDCDTAPQAVLVRAKGLCPRQTFPPHAHGRSELVYVRSGTLSVTAEEKVFTVGEQNALLIPAGVTHDMRILSSASVLAVYIAPPQGSRSDTPCRHVQVSALLRELLHVAAAFPATYDPEGREGWIMALIAAEVAGLATQPAAQALHTPIPRDARLLRVCRELLDNLDRPWTIDQAAMAAGMGRRTFTRRFRSEMGVSFITWSARARLNAAVGRLNEGASITQVAFESGYNSPSAFATMFKRSLGVAPSNYQVATACRRVAAS